MNEIEIALKILKDKTVDLLLGFQSYPTNNEDNHITRLITLKRILDKKYDNFRIGFADHAQTNDELKYAIACAAIGAGSRVLEKHLTLGKVMEMEDFESALNPDEFKEFVHIVKQCSLAIGKTYNISNDFNMSKSERTYRKTIRRHVVSAKNLKKDDIIKSKDLLLKRTSAKEPIYDLNSVYNKKLKNNIAGNSSITLNDIY